MGKQTGENENLVNGEWQNRPFEVGPLGFGCWRLLIRMWNGDRPHRPCFDLGLTLVDNADVYGLDWGGTAFGRPKPCWDRFWHARRNCASAWYWQARVAFCRAFLMSRTPPICPPPAMLACAPQHRTYRPLSNPPTRHAHPPRRNSCRAGWPCRRRQNKRRRRFGPHAPQVRVGRPFESAAGCTAMRIFAGKSYHVARRQSGFVHGNRHGATGVVTAGRWR